MWKDFIKGNFIKPNQTFTPSGRPRQHYIDLAKGICMLLVVAMHCSVVFHFPLPVVFRNLRMPLYFMLSGLFFRDYGGFFNLLEKKTNKILVPLIFFSITGFLFSELPDILSGDDLQATLSESFFNFPTNYALWFLIALAFDNFIFFYLKRLLRNNLLILPLTILMSMVTYLIDSRGIQLPFFISPIVNGLVFFTLGQILATTPVITSARTSWLQLTAGIGIFMLGLMLRYFFGAAYLDYKVNNWVGNPFLTYCISFFLVIGFMFICKHVKWLPIVSYIGRYSIIVLGVHITLMTIAYRLPIDFHRYPLVFYGIVLGASWLLIPILKRYFPQFTAQNEGVVRLRPLRIRNK